MKRNPLLNLLKNYRPVHDHDKKCLEQITAFVLSHEDCFDRQCLEGHITASAWIVHPQEAKILLMFHRKLGAWLQLGGHADGDPNVLEVALKEAREESGIEDIIPLSTEIFDLDVHVIPQLGEVPQHLHYDIRFLLKAKIAKINLNESEAIDLRWFSRGELRQNSIDPSVKRMLEKWELFPS